MNVTMQDILARKKRKISKGIVPPVIDVPRNATIRKEEGIDELLECLSPASFDFGCVVRNLNWLVNTTLNNFYLSCSLGAMSPAEGVPGRYVSSGVCTSWWGIPGIAAAQRCSDFDSVTKSVATCKNKCAAESKTFEAAGCDGSTIWCWCTD